MTEPGLESNSGAVASSGQVRVFWAAGDHFRAVTVAVFVSIAIAAALAVFGLPSIDMHSPLHHAGIMDPFCGGTRALRYAALGHWSPSWTYNPLGILTVLLLGAGAVRALIGWSTGRWLTVSILWTRRRVWLVIGIVAMLTIALEIRQQSIADLLMGP